MRPDLPARRGRGARGGEKNTHRDTIQARKDSKRDNLRKNKVVDQQENMTEQEN